MMAYSLSKLSHRSASSSSVKVHAWARGVGGGGSGDNLGVILVWVCEPVFQNVPHSYTWPLKKWTHSYT